MFELLHCARRYAVVPTPLSRLRFLRLVLDEAQQVQGSTAKAAEMARKIQARHRWAVTGASCVEQWRLRAAWRQCRRQCSAGGSAVQV